MYVASMSHFSKFHPENILYKYVFSFQQINWMSGRLGVRLVLVINIVTKTDKDFVMVKRPHRVAENLIFTESKVSM